MGKASETGSLPKIKKVPENEDVIQTKISIFLIPLTYAYVCFFAAIYYVLWKDIRMVIKAVFVGSITSVLLFLLIPDVLPLFTPLPNVFETDFWLIYLYTISTIVSISVIEEQKRYYNGLTLDKGQGTQPEKGKTRPLIQPKYLYFLLPLTYECICFIAAINYLLWKDVRIVVKVLFIALVTSIIVFIIPHVILPLYSSSPGILQTDFWFIYLYLLVQ